MRKENVNITFTIQGLVVWAIISRSSQKNAESDLLIYDKI